MGVYASCFEANAPEMFCQRAYHLHDCVTTLKVFKTFLSVDCVKVTTVCRVVQICHVDSREAAFNMGWWRQGGKMTSEKTVVF
jgi:hypothetical protein